MRLLQCDPRMRTTNLFDWMDDFFGGSGTAPRSDDAAWAPRTDVREAENEYDLSIDLPGVEKGDIKITVQDGLLEIAGERNLETQEGDEGYNRLERFHGSFRRTFRLPKEVRVDQIESTYEKGVLRIRIPKAEEALPKQIEVKVK